MKILAGIDEAGLGPTLGPMVTACTAFRVPDAWEPSTPWTVLTGLVTGTPSKRATIPCIADSKAVHAKLGMPGLERGILAFIPTEGLHTRADVADRMAPDTARERASYPWYTMEAEPSALDPEALDAARSASRAISDCLAAHGAAFEWLRALPLYEEAMNDAFASGLNKSDATIRQTGRCLRHLADTFPTASIDVTIDRQGGRAFYHPFLMRLFPGDWIDIGEETPKSSSYRIRRPEGELRIEFRVKADATAAAVALASMGAKWLREWHMARFNAWFAARVPELRPTAGYPEDAKRFLADIAPLLADCSIPARRLIRER